ASARVLFEPDLWLRQRLRARRRAREQWWAQSSARVDGQLPLPVQSLHPVRIGSQLVGSDLCPAARWSGEGRLQSYKSPMGVRDDTGLLDFTYGSQREAS